MLKHSAGHPWVQVDGVAPDRPLDSAVLSRMKQFSAMNRLKKMALRVSIGVLNLYCLKLLLLEKYRSYKDIKLYIFKFIYNEMEHLIY